MPIAKRAFIMIWDGMRPDLISDTLTPNLARLARDGVRFLDSHAVFPTVTRVNAASLATGALPGAHGIVGNSLYAPLVEPRASISIGDHHSLYRLIETRGGRLLARDTLADRVHASGGRTVVISSGSPGSAFLCHPRVRECAGDLIFNPAISLPDGTHQTLTARCGEIPAQMIPNTTQNAYFTRVVTEYVLPELEPRLLIFWHNDPDLTQHHRGFGSPAGLAAIREADANLGLVLAALERYGLRQRTAIAVASDHGYATREPLVDPRARLAGAGLAAELADGRLILSHNGFVFFVNAPDGEPGLIQRVVEACQAWEHVGLVFSGARGRPPLAGTLPLALVGLDGDLAPDVLCAFAWDDLPNAHGYAGRSAGLDAKYLASHGGLSRWEVRNTLVLAGPGLQRGLDDPLPAGNLDLAPTMLHLLGVEPPANQHGRVLTEALVGGPRPAELQVQPEQVTAERGGYRQGVRFSLVGDTRYLDYGWAERRPVGGLIELS